jgi:tetratricopeptide (TPR) repeat protein
MRVGAIASAPPVQYQPKGSPVEKLTKQDLRSPDAFISSARRALEKIAEYRSVLLVVVAIAIVGGVVWAAFGSYNHKREEKAQASLFVAEKKLKAIEDGFNKASNPPNLLPAAKDAKKDKKDVVPQGPKPTGDLEADYREALKPLREVVETYPGTQAFVVASLNLAELYNQHGKYAEGIPLLEKAAQSAKHPVTKGFVWNQLGLAHQGKGDCGKAIEYWQKIEADKNLGFLHGTSLIRTGLCYEDLKQFDKAEQAYHRAEGLTGDADASKAARKYLRLLKRGQNS